MDLSDSPEGKHEGRPAFPRRSAEPGGHGGGGRAFTGNTLLLGLPASSLQAFEPLVRPIALSLHQTVISTGDPISFVYFPETAVFSEVVRLRDGAMAEINLVGREGMAGLEAYLGAPKASLDVMTLVAGAALQMPLDALVHLANGDPELRRSLNLYTQAVHNVRAIAAACDRLHPVHTRLVRWLLRTHDRLDIDDFVLTQDDIASLLGVARQTVTANALLLQEAGLISYAHGRLHLLDRPGIERLACECYWNLNAQWERLPPAEAADHETGQSSLSSRK